ncbi:MULTISPECIES: DUF4232 domain-containing protein [unclassified Streptomyces]|uniref:DUF4232 domain-containing protein n=1 Tax=unclassified Streptomyces TaxID=2593676 RepID=UPI0036F0C11A
MRTFHNRHRATATVIGATAVLALTLTACAGQAAGAKAAGSADSSVSVAASAGTSRSTGPVKTSNAVHAIDTTHAAARNAVVTNSADGNANSDNSDNYASTHPCQMQKLSLHVTRRAGAPTQRVIEVRNVGAHACGLSHYPRVSLGNSQSADHSHDVRPLVPGRLGGAPAFPVRAGHTAYAVIDLDPSGTTTGTVAGIDEMNVLADGDHMPNADTLNFPLGPSAKVLRPKLGLYRNTVTDAVVSMTGADTQS